MLFLAAAFSLAVHHSPSHSLRKFFLFLFVQGLTCATGSKEILYRVQLPYMEELTLVYLEKEGDEPHEELSKS